MHIFVFLKKEGMHMHGAMVGSKLLAASIYLLAPIK
jgi:hypothetical protein